MPDSIPTLEELLNQVKKPAPAETPKEEPAEEKPAEELKHVEATEEVAEPVKEPVKEAAPTPAPAPRQRKKPSPVLRYKNEITLRGTIAKMVEAKNVTVITMAVKATMTISNYPTIMFFGDTREQVYKFKEGDRVYVKATLQSYDEKKLRKGQ